MLRRNDRATAVVYFGRFSRFSTFGACPLWGTSMGQKWHHGLESLNEIHRINICDGTAPDCIDTLTHLPDRKRLRARLDDELRLARADPDYHFAVLMLNLNRFKAVNDCFGQDRGDELLKLVGDHILASVRTSDLVCRIGADEFVIVLSNAAGVNEVNRISHRLLHAPITPFRVNGRGVPVSIAIGAVLVSDAEATTDDILKRGGLALERAKSSGCHALELYSQDRHGDGLLQAELEGDLLRGIEHGEFFLHYQPIISLKDFEIAGFEALLRWRHPTRGLVPPVQFIPILERNGLIEQLGIWILERGCQELRLLRSACGREELFLTLNVSRRQLFAPSFAETARRIVLDQGIPPTRLCFEITETLVLDVFDVVVNNLTALRQFGIKIFIDDFGVGYSSLNSLYRLPVDTLKIDRMFVRAMETAPKCEAIVRMIIEMGHELEMSLVAEGIEGPRELERLASMHCDFAQGFLFSKAVDRDTAVALLRNHCSWQAYDRVG